MQDFWKKWIGVKLHVLFFCCFHTFANDTNWHLPHKDNKMLQTNGQNELDKVDTWICSNRLSQYHQTIFAV